MSAPLSLAAWRLAMGLAEPVAPLVLRARARRGKEAAHRLGERLGHAGRERPEGALVWLHGASVGESMSLLPLVERLRAERPDLALLVTSGTRTSAELLGQRLPPGALHQFAPVDAPGAVARFLDHWRPAAGLFVESELWPNLILAARDRGVRLALLSARMTEKSARGWARGPGAARTVLGAFETILAQDDATAARLERLGAVVAGRLNLKRVGAPLAVDAAELAALKPQVGGRTVVLAASTHPGEDALIVGSALVQRAAPLPIVVPRHPERGDAIAGELRQAGFTVAQRSRGEPLAGADLYLADTLGEIALFYALADIVVMGGGYAAGVGGHNPLEAARLGRGVVSGPAVSNHAEVFAEMAAAGAALIVEADALRETLADLLMAPERIRTMGERATAYADDQGASFEAGWRSIVPLLPAA